MKESQQEMLKKLELDEKAHKELLRYCQKKKIMFLSSPFDEQSLELLVKLKVKMIKVASGEITNFPFLEKIALAGKTIILSTGMATLKEVKQALNVLYKAGNEDVALLHCVTEYPAPVEEVNLKAMDTMQKAFKVPVGYSDHTLDIEIAIAAVALGAGIIEKHLTLDKNMKGPDHKASLDPDEFANLVKSIRNVEKALGNGIKKPALCEKKNIDVVRKSLVAADDILKNAKIKREQVVAKRPGNGIPPKDLERLLKKRARMNIKKDDVLQWGQFL